MALTVRTMILAAVAAVLSGCAHGPWLQGHDTDPMAQMQTMHAQMMHGMHAMHGKGMAMMGGGGGCMDGMDHAEPAAPK